MGVLDYFKPVSVWTADEVRGFLEKNSPDSYNLVDVRQPVEYEEGHLPGARLMPLGELTERVAELDPEKTTIVYCAAGVRSRAGASILERSGFRQVSSMSGGIHAWRGAVAQGFPEAGFRWFGGAATTGELIALAWLLEEGARSFYGRMAEKIADRRLSSIFAELMAAEERHEARLASLYREVSGVSGDVDFPSILGESPGRGIMEGGIGVDEAVAWAEGKSPAEIAEFSISMEAVSYDRYLAMAEKGGDDGRRRLFTGLAAEEKSHLARLTAMFEDAL